MHIEPTMTDEAVLAELGARLERTRLDRNLTQRQLASDAGVEYKAVRRIESGESVRLTTLVRVLRALGLLEGLDRLVPESVPSPIELLRLRGRERRRATGSRGRGRDGSREGGPWRWGDEAQ